MTSSAGSTKRTRGNRTLRFFDRYVGVPLMSLFGLLPKRAFDPAKARRIGLMKTAGIGDIVLLAGIVKDVRAQYPNAMLVLITGEDNAAAGRLLLADRDQHIIVSPHRPRAAIGAIRRAKLDVIVDFGPWPRFDAMLAVLSGARLRVGFRTHGQARHFGYDRSVDYSDIGHEIDNFRRLVQAIGVRSSSSPAIAPPRVLTSDRLPRRPYAVFHAWPGGLMQEVKEWPTDRWAALAQRVARGGRTIVLTGSQADGGKSRMLAAAIATTGVPILDAAGTLSISELADLLVASDVVVSVNTGVMHLAAAVGARVVGLQGPTSSARWGPIGERTRAVDSSFSECGYLNLGWEYAGHRLDCMNGVAVEAVVAAVESLLPA